MEMENQSARLAGAFSFPHRYLRQSACPMEREKVVKCEDRLKAHLLSYQSIKTVIGLGRGTVDHIPVIADEHSLLGRRRRNF